MNNLQAKSLTGCARAGACAHVILNVLIACEESQAECAAFRELDLPPLVATQDYPNPKEFVRSSRGKYRSRTFPQLARAIALQWSDYIINTKLDLLEYARRTK